MRRAAVVLMLLLVSNVAFGVPPDHGHPVPTAIHKKPLPDLVITSFGLTSWGPCAPGQTVFTFSVTFKNQGSVSWSGATPYLDVRDLHPDVTANWFYNVNIYPPMKPGEVRTLQIPFPYFSKNPAHMGQGCPHPFQAVINPSHAVQESNYANNAGPGPAVWNGIKVIMVCPDACQK